MHLHKTLDITLIGDKEAILVAQLNYWLRKSRHVHGDRKWVFNSIKDWKTQFPCYSEKTIARVFRHLEELGIVLTGNFNRTKYDRTKWYSLNYDRLSEITGITYSSSSNKEQLSGQTDQMDGNTVTEPIPETTTETTTKTTTENTIRPWKPTHLDEEHVKKTLESIVNDMSNIHRVVTS